MELVLDDEVGRQVMPGRVGDGPPLPSSAPTSRFQGIIANLSTVPMTRDGRFAVDVLVDDVDGQAVAVLAVVAVAAHSAIQVRSTIP